MKLLFSLLITLTLTTSLFAQTDNQFGKKITDTDAIPATQLAAKLGTKEAMPAKVEGVVESVCKVKGCWMTVKTSEGKTMRVTFRDYGFFVPKDITGKTVVVEGIAQTSTTSVAQLRHYAEDDGKSKADIEKITKPETDLSFVADGVIIKK
ncbi:MAG: DUF4920 domain-containing protein [Bacteroidetes bacterium]|nr:DUF4920 domain-containing protein [Fibrella sp.]